MTTYALVHDDGHIIKRRQFPNGAPTLSDAKPFRWIVDSPPPVEPWQTRLESTPIPTDATEVPYTVEDRPLATVQAQRIEQIRQKRDRGIMESAFVDLGDDDVVVAPIASSEQMSRVTALYVRAERAERKGENRTFHMTDAHGNARALATDHMLALGDAVLDAGQTWESACQRHIEAVRAKTTAKDAWEYDDDLENDGWPTAV